MSMKVAADVETEMAAIVLRDHDYGCRGPSTGELDGAVERLQQIQKSVSNLALTGPLCERWCMSEDDFRYFTRFPSKEIFFHFWASVEPSASMNVYWSKAKRAGCLPEVVEQELTCPHELPLIDEFFMFCLYLSVGLKEQILSGMFRIHYSRVIQIIVTWSNYLYLVLGSVQIWMTRAQVRQMMPLKKQQLSLCTRVIIDCSELRCEIGELKMSADTLSCEMNCTTFKALVGVAPCGLISFVSELFPDAISNDDMTRRCGILNLLEPGDEVIAGKDFCSEDLFKNVGARLVRFPLSSEDECNWTQGRAQDVARFYALVRCIIRRIKEYQLLNLTIPHTLAGSVNQIWTCCCLMANYHVRFDPNGEETSTFPICY
ncbi:PREDICTED: uncharacterized protein LOC107089280 [Cyprinodon variegatus]|uniref:uncharacterized protein LOC107089280 n=1 Tax=Cyprinodon variegatus TaxID=28743 RepID=UPI00074277C2|nr:PREDICTED: uncharacterized protein LOC107089280 [Cyprinodon variegatus]